MAVCVLWQFRTSSSRLPKFSLRLSRRTPPACNICSSSTQTISASTDIFRPLPREELVTKFRSRLKDRPFMVGSTGEGFPEFLGEPRDSFPHAVLINNPHQSSLAELTVNCMEYVEENLADYPAILFRNLPAQTAQDFSIIAQGIPWKAIGFTGGPNYRKKIDKNARTYTSNNDPCELSINPHNELAYTDAYPSKVSSKQVKIRNLKKLCLTGYLKFRLFPTKKALSSHDGDADVNVTKKKRFISSTHFVDIHRQTTTINK